MIRQPLSVFFPVYNEEASLKNVINQAIKVLGKTTPKWEIVIIDDGSTDNSLKNGAELAKKNPRVRVISMENKGYGGALKMGFESAKYDLVIYTDSDGQFDFQEISKFLGASNSSDAVWGFRLKRNDPFVRSVLSKTWSLSLLLLFGLRLKDVNCGFKLIKKSAYLHLGKLNSDRGGMINAELAVRLKEKGFKITEVGVHHFPRKFGVPTGGSLIVAIHSYIDLLKLWLGS